MLRATSVADLGVSPVTPLTQPTSEDGGCETEGQKMATSPYRTILINPEPKSSEFFGGFEALGTAGGKFAVF